MLITDTLVVSLSFLGEGIAGLIEDHGLVILLFKEFQEFNLFIHFSQSLLQILVFGFELPNVLAIHNLLSGDADLRIGVLEIYSFIFALLLNNL